MDVFLYDDKGADNYNAIDVDFEIRINALSSAFAIMDRWRFGVLLIVAGLYLGATVLWIAFLASLLI